MILFDRGGMLSRMLTPIGLSLPKLVRDEWGLGVIIAMAWKAVPFMTLIIAGSVASIPEDLKAAARTLGANRLTTFFRIELPLALPGITAATLLVFVSSTAYALAKIPFRAKRAVEIFILAPLIVPGLIVGVGIGYVFFRIGLAYTVPGVILAQTIGTLPFMIRVLSATLEAVPADLIRAARTLGATPLKVGWFILIPLAWPGFVAGGLLSFVASFEEFEKTFIVGAPLVETLTVKLWATLGGKVMIFPNAAVVTFIVLMPTVIIFFLAERAMKNDGALAAGMGKL